MSDSTLSHEKIQAFSAGIADSVNAALIEGKVRHAKQAAENYIHHAPLKSVLIAAGTGAATALAVSWLMHLRKH